jgi:hypothetical protein
MPQSRLETMNCMTQVSFFPPASGMFFPFHRQNYQGPVGIDTKYVRTIQTCPWLVYGAMCEFPYCRNKVVILSRYMASCIATIPSSAYFNSSSDTFYGRSTLQWHQENLPVFFLKFSSSSFNCGSKTPNGIKIQTIFLHHVTPGTKATGH